MRIASVWIQGFRAFKEFSEIKCGPFTTIVGRNDTGKSSVLHALGIFFDAAPDERDFNRDMDQDAPLIVQVSFTDLPNPVQLEEGIDTDLQAENLLDVEHNLTVRKTYGRKNPKKPKLHFLVNDFTDSRCQNLCSRDEKDLNSIGNDLGLNLKKSGAGITNKAKREAIRQWAAKNKVGRASVEVEPDGAAVRVLEYFPNFSLFRADESLSEEQASFQKEFKEVIESAVSKIPGKAEIEKGVEKELDAEVQKIHSFLLKHTDEVASIKARPSFKWKDLISFYLECRDKQGKEVAFAKRGSGLRRLLMVAYFQYLAQRAKEEGSKGTQVYGIEEPETYLHPGAQRELLDSFRDITASHQVLVSSHSPVFAGSTDINNLVLIIRDAGLARALQGAQLELVKVADELGVEPCDQIYGYKAIVFVEGRDDCEFLSMVARTLSSCGQIPSNFEDKRVGVLPGGGDNLKHWITRKAIKGINRRYAVILDSDRKSSADSMPPAKLKLKEEVERDGGLCHILRKREIENYLHPRVIEEKTGKQVQADDFDFVDLKAKYGREIAGLAQHMTAEQILERDCYTENGLSKHELQEICQSIIDLPR